MRSGSTLARVPVATSDHSLPQLDRNAPLLLRLRLLPAALRLNTSSGQVDTKVGP